MNLNEGQQANVEENVKGPKYTRRDNVETKNIRAKYIKQSTCFNMPLIKDIN